MPIPYSTDEMHRQRTVTLPTCDSFYCQNFPCAYKQDRSSNTALATETEIGIPLWRIFCDSLAVLSTRRPAAIAIIFCMTHVLLLRMAKSSFVINEGRNDETDIELIQSLLSCSGREQLMNLMRLQPNCRNSFAIAALGASATSRDLTRASL